MFPSHTTSSSLKSARSRYEQYLDEMAKTKTLNQKELKRKIICDEISEVRKKKSCYEDAIKRNIEEADRISIEAEGKNDFTLLSQANDLRKANKEKKTLVDDLEKMEANLISRRDGVV